MASKTSPLRVSIFNFFFFILIQYFSTTLEKTSTQENRDTETQMSLLKMLIKRILMKVHKEWDQRAQITTSVNKLDNSNTKVDLVLLDKAPMLALLLNLPKFKTEKSLENEITEAAILTIKKEKHQDHPDFLNIKNSLFQTSKVKLTNSKADNEILVLLKSSTDIWKNNTKTFKLKNKN